MGSDQQGFSVTFFAGQGLSFESELFRGSHGLFKTIQGDVAFGFHNKEFAPGLEGLPYLSKECALVRNFVDQVDSSSKIHLT